MRVYADGANSAIASEYSLRAEGGQLDGLWFGAWWERGITWWWLARGR